MRQYILILLSKKGCYLLCMVLLTAACKKAEPLTFDHAANIYFDLSQEQRDSISYTFAYDLAKAADTINIPVTISGKRISQDRFYTAYVEADSSTAVAGIHYKPLEQQYPIRADQGKAVLPLVVYNRPDLEDSSRTIILKLKASPDLGIENPTIIRTRVVLSARLEQPAWWIMWCGAYSRTKHQLFLIVTGITELSTAGLDAPKNLYIANLLTVMLNNPFDWVANNAGKGYVLEAVTPGNTNTYYFYTPQNPNKKILLQKNTGSGRYFFIDENGQEVR
ncbi:DUF4843 domain-containing protein [Niabella hibiscisoli]|uniref:DUF4843 domain-containing protein n=1 Tax=Niabella hibiscisoli TaxID=1825928 RepID=UPI001F0DDA65|nr:DUF4843 domain-containing protein [Niabella hibiscisoli]MCH5717416.1 DUF4843 domain-containing protein [Niabella hibiscisoli]